VADTGPELGCGPLRGSRRSLRGARASPESPARLRRARRRESWARAAVERDAGADTARGGARGGVHAGARARLPRGWHASSARRARAASRDPAGASPETSRCVRPTRGSAPPARAASRVDAREAEEQDEHDEPRVRDASSSSHGRGAGWTPRGVARSAAAASEKLKRHVDRSSFAKREVR
jgi:hypothetical protein